MRIRDLDARSPLPANGYLDVRKLTYFLAVAEELSFRGAATKMGISQAAVSEQIRSLETELQVSLFERRSRQIRLTEAGLALLSHAREITTLTRGAREHIRQIAGVSVGRLTVGFISLLNYTVLPLVVRQFRTSYSGVKLILREATSDVQAVDIAEGRMDVGFVVPPVAHNSLTYLPIFHEPLVLAVPESSPLAGAQAEVSLSEVAGEPFIIFPRASGPSLYDQIQEHCRTAGFTPFVVQEAVQMQTIVSLVAGGLGVSIVPASIRNLMREGVVYKKIKEAGPLAETGVIHRRGYMPGCAKAFLDLVRQAAARASAGAD